MFNQMPYMPNYNTMPLNSTGGKILKKFNWSNILSNTQKILNVANQAIPLYYQVKPIMNNLKTINKIGKEFKNINNNPKTNTKVEKEIVENNTSEGPNFFL